MTDEFYRLLILYSTGLIITISLVFLTYFISNKFNLKVNKENSNYIFFFSLTFYIISIFYLSFSKINALHHYGDFATHLEILWKNHQGLGLTTLIAEDKHGGSHWFSAHFTPIIYLTYIPAFSIFQSPYMLPISQTFFILSSLIPLWLISRRYLDKNLSRLYISCFLFYPTIFYMNLYSIAYVEISIPLLLWLFYFLERKNNFFFLVFLILTLMTREEISFVTCFVGIYILLNKRYILGITTILISITYYYIVISMIMPLYKTNPSTEHLSFYQFLRVWGADNFSEMLKIIIFDPINSLRTILVPEKVGNYVVLLMPLLFLPLLSILRFLISLPTIGIGLLSWAKTHSSFMFYYVSPIVAIFFYSAIFGIKKVCQNKMVNKNALLNSLLMASILMSVFFGATPISIAFWNKEYKVGIFYTTNFHRSVYKETDRHIAAKKIINFIPINSVVSAEQHFLPLLYKHNKMIIFPSPEDDIEYVLIDRYNPKKSGGYFENTMRTDPEAEYRKYFENSNWKILKQELGITLFKKK